MAQSKSGYFFNRGATSWGGAHMTQTGMYARNEEVNKTSIALDRIGQMDSQ
ncbi:MAG TPA: hypothetical protein VFZ27_02260 [Terriglobia bacterium]|nr:hypothetical protein [Terriglobia bacterium]